MPLQKRKSSGRTEIFVKFQEFDARADVADRFDKRIAKERAEWIVAGANMIGGEPAEWLARVIRRGPSLMLLQELEKAIGDVRQCSTLVLDKKNKRFNWVPVESNRLIDVMYPLCLVSVINAGLSDRLKRCALTECRKFFFGDPRKKWCSDACGSKVRVREKRRKDRERQML